MSRSIVASIVCILVGGCSTGLDIKVERIQPRGQIANEYARVNELDQVVAQQIGALRVYIESTLDMEKKLGENKNAISEFTKTVRASADTRIEKGKKLNNELHAFNLTPQVPDSLRNDVLSYKQDVAIFLHDQHDVWEKYINRFSEGSETRSSLEDAYEDMVGTKLVDAQRASSQKRLGYQGFIVDEVFEISASDPNYESVLFGTPIPQAITHVNAQALGDSSVLFVQENPTQMRIYHVETDVEKLVQNAMFIFDKTLSAAIKYMGPVPDSSEE